MFYEGKIQIESRSFRKGVCGAAAWLWEKLRFSFRLKGGRRFTRGLPWNSGVLCRDGVFGGLPAGTIERARLTATWAAGEVPGSEGKPPKPVSPSPLNRRMLLPRPSHQKRTPPPL